MSEYSPRPKTGYTRTGKSLKAVRRYYALKNADRERQRSPRKSRDDEDNRPRRSPADDKLSKRIAAELKHQAAANEKRSLRSPNAQNDDGPTPPIIISPKETGPVFIAEPPNKSAKSAKSVKSTKTVKSHKSAGAGAQHLPIDYIEPNLVFGSFSMGCVVASCLIALVYVLNWILANISPNLVDDLDKNPKNTLPTALSLGIISIFVIVTSIYWLNFRFGFIHAVISLLVMMLSTLCVGAYIIYTSVTNMHESSRPTTTVSPVSGTSSSRIRRDNMLFLLAITYLVVLFISTGMMVKQVISLRSARLNNKNKPVEVTQMSHFLAPH